MSLPSLPVAHLSDEAVAAYADDALSEAARSRAARHIAECTYCARAVEVQREAVRALRAAPAPALPRGLLDRLRAVPTTTPLNQRPLALDANGSAVFPAYGTDASAVDSAGPDPANAAAADSANPVLPVHDAGPATRPPQPAPMSHARRSRPYGLLTAAAAVVALGGAGFALAGSGASGPVMPAQNAPASPAQVRPARLGPADLDPSGPMFLRPASQLSAAVRTPR